MLLTILNDMLGKGKVKISCLEGACPKSSGAGCSCNGILSKKMGQSYIFISEEGITFYFFTDDVEDYSEDTEEPYVIVNTSDEDSKKYQQKIEPRD